jgi:dienelactone hydrolase
MGKTAVGWFGVSMAMLGCAAALAQQPAPQAPAAPPPPEAFYRQPDIGNARLSPSGRWLALSTTRGANRIGLVVFDTRDWGKWTQAARFTDADIGNFGWVNDDTLTFDVLDTTRGSGDQRLHSGIFSVRRDGNELRQHTHLTFESQTFQELRLAKRDMLSRHHFLLQVLPGNGNDVIVGERRYANNGELLDVVAKRLDVTTGRTRSLAQGVPPNAHWWSFDPSGEPRAVTTQFEGRVSIHWRGNDGQWQRIADHKTFEMPFTPHSIDAAGTFYVTRRGPHDTTVFTTFDFASGQPVEPPLASAKGFDFWGGPVSETIGGKTLGVRMLTDAETTVWFDPRMAELQKAADARWPGQVNRLDCRRCDQPDRVVLLRSWSDRNPGQYWVWLDAERSWRMLGAVRDAIVPAQMGTTDLVRIAARDGRDLPVWVTRPPGPKSPRAAVVLVHGGPWVRGRSWNWNDDAQFLASRGYVVIEPEYRGSAGYGFAHFRAGWQQWGRAMQDDVADALQWAVKNEGVDAKRVCIAGASYGGYATLMGLARHPDMYRCGVAWVGVTDPRLLFRWSVTSDVRTESREHSYPELIGDPQRDAAMLDSVTPLLLADRIKQPVMLAYGRGDRRVPIEHGERMRDALVKAGNAPQWTVYDDEGHGWLKLETRVDFAQRLERFLAEHLR